MEDLDMRPGAELFPEIEDSSQHDVHTDSDVGSPLDSGVEADGVADQKMSDKELNFRALREEAAKLKQEMSYWRGQAEAYSKSSVKSEPSNEQADAYSALDWYEPKDVKKAFESLRSENERLRNEMKDSLIALQTKASRQDWDNMVKHHVPQLTEKNPLFAEMIQNASNPYEAAYILAELSSRAEGSAQRKTHDADYGRRVEENSRKPQSVASVGGNSRLSRADYYAQMSDKEFMEMAAKNLANI